VGTVTRTRDEILAWIVVELARELRVDADSLDTAAPLFSLGASSLIAISITGALSEWLGRDLDATLMWDHPTIDAIADALGKTSPAVDALPPGIIVLHAGGSLTPLFCFPGAGGHSTTFAPLAARIGFDRAVYGLTVPGINGEREPFTSVEEIAAEMLLTIRRVQPYGPFQLAAYSFGGLLAYEVAQRLRSAGESVAVLAIYDAFTSAGLVLRPRWQRIALHAFLLATKSGRREYIRKQLRRRRGERQNLDFLRRQALSPEEVGSRIALQVESANFRASSTYVPTPYAGSIVLFRPAARAVESIFYRVERVTNGWGALAPGRVLTIELPGSHLTLLDPEHAEIAAERLRTFLSPYGSRQ
jgi:oxalate---CoA ligase